MLVVGTRPEAIKLSPVAAALAARGLAPTLVLTGQHRDLDPADHGLARYPAFRLDCPGQKDPNVHVGLVCNALVPLLAVSSPALVVVQGDTSSALGGALAARIANVPLAHVEAGLRSHDKSQPWPEEEFRIAIDECSALLFAPTELGAANLRREKAGGRIHVTGNSGIDALAKRRRSRRDRRAGPRRLLVTCHRRENWGRGIDRVEDALAELANGDGHEIDIILPPNPAVARRIRAMERVAPRIRLLDPCGHDTLIDAMLDSDLVLSDSGGMQEEAAALGVPLLVLREKTERPEAVACGSVELVGTDPGRIVAAVRRRLKDGIMPEASQAFGDGRASERIAAIIGEWLVEQAALADAPGANDLQPVRRIA